jgi:hypothetical protein
MKSTVAAATSRTFVSSLVALVVMSVGSTAAIGCAPMHGFHDETVKLAHPTMDAADMTSPAEAHIRGINEGAVSGSGGSGCGCN